MYDPICPGCRERDARIAELERLLAAAGHGVALAVVEAPPAAGPADAVDHRRRRRRVRLSANQVDLRRRRKEARAAVSRYAILAGAALLAMLAIWLLFSVFGGPGQP
jgi:hypothetical protein